jgi:hypothetical protein
MFIISVYFILLATSFTQGSLIQTPLPFCGKLPQAHLTNYSNQNFVLRHLTITTTSHCLVRLSHSHSGIILSEVLVVFAFSHASS